MLLLPEIVFLFLLGGYLLSGRLIVALRKKDYRGLLPGTLLTYPVAVIFSFGMHPGQRSGMEAMGVVYLFILGILFYDYMSASAAKIGWVLRCFFLSGTLCSVVLIIGYGLQRLGYPTEQFTRYAQYPIIGDVDRAIGFTRHPIFLGSFLLASIFMALALFSQDIRKWQGWQFAGMGLLLTGVLMTWVKSLLPFAIAMLFLWYQTWKNRAKITKPVFLSGSGLLLIAYLFFTHFSLVKHKQLPELLGATYSAGTAWALTASYSLMPTKYFLLKKTAWLAWLQHPIFGVGGDQLILFNDSLYKQQQLPVPLPNSPHSTVMGSLGELGVVGFVSIIAIFTACWKVAGRIRDNWVKNVFHAFLVFLAIDSISGDQMNMRHLWIIFAVLAAISHFSSANPEKWKF